VLVLAASEGLYAFARISPLRFKGIAALGTTAAHAAGLHTAYALCVCIPVAIVFCLHVSRKDT
jgi:L-alanine-DL-glutamate epimerase-like enolase superfamily enzyme